MSTVIFFVFIVAAIVTIISIQARPGPSEFSDIGKDDHLIFFRSSAWLDEQNREWKIPIQGWIYKPQYSSVRKSAFRAILKSRYDLEANDETEVNFTQRLNLLLADNERGRRIIISFAGQNYVLPKSKANGHFSKVLSLPVKSLETITKEDIIEFKAITSPNEAREFSGEVKLVTPIGFSVISDIDDTIKISNVSNKKLLLDNTFFNDFFAAPGMPEIYRSISEQKVSFHYVSSSPWHLYPPLLDFVERNDFPWASFDLKFLRLKDKSILNLFKAGTETKPSQIEPIFLRYPKRKFILVGDSGEHDPEVYSQLIKKYPEQIIRIYIRNVNGQSRTDQRFTELFAGIAENRWDLFTEPQQLDLSVVSPQ